MSSRRTVEAEEAITGANIDIKIKARQLNEANERGNIALTAASAGDTRPLLETPTHPVTEENLG